jgi:hypothetical protein
MYDVIYEAEIALCNINKLPLQLKSADFNLDSIYEATYNICIKLIFHRELVMC